MAETIGSRVRFVRDALKVDQWEFARRLNRLAEQLGIGARYDNTAVSKLENGRRDMNIDDLFLVSDLDPKKRGPRWLWSGERPKHNAARTLPPAEADEDALKRPAEVRKRRGE